MDLEGFWWILGGSGWIWVVVDLGVYSAGFCMDLDDFGWISLDLGVGGRYKRPDRPGIQVDTYI